MIDLRKKDDMIAAIEQILQQEALKGNQHLIDKNKNNKVDPEDFKILRGEKKTVKEEETVTLYDTFDKYVHSVSQVPLWEMENIKDLIDAYFIDPKSMTGVAKKVHKHHKEKP